MDPAQLRQKERLEAEIGLLLQEAQQALAALVNVHLPVEGLSEFGVLGMSVNQHSQNVTDRSEDPKLRHRLCLQSGHQD